MFATSLALLGVNAIAAAAEPEYYDALRLVSAMREDEMMLLAFRSTAEKRVRRAEVKQEDITCLDAMEFPEVTDIPARRISEKLTQAELTEAIAFFQGPVGQEYVRRRALILTGRPAVAGSVAASDGASFTAFKKTSAGQKLLTQRVASNAGAMNEALARVDLALGDCAYTRDPSAQRRNPTGYCESRPVASPDHVCLAAYVTTEKSPARHTAEIRVDCERDGRIMTTTMENPQPDTPVALRWEEPRRLVILMDDPKIRIVSSTGGDSTAQRYRFASRQAGDPPVVKCLPKTFGPSLARVLPVPTTIGAWRSYRSGEVCQMTARVRHGTAGREGDVLLHFRQSKQRALPFASTSLVFAVQLFQPRTQVVLTQGSSRMELIDASNQQIHMLEGRAAMSLFDVLRTQSAKITAKPSVGESYAIPVDQEDFAFAATGFDACIKSL